MSHFQGSDHLGAVPCHKGVEQDQVGADFDCLVVYRVSKVRADRRGAEQGEGAPASPSPHCGALSADGEEGQVRHHHHHRVR